MRLISTTEQTGFPLGEELSLLLNGQKQYAKYISEHTDDAFCYCIEHKADSYFVQASYFVGVDWITKDIAIQVKPKIEDDKTSIDYLQMLAEALQEPENTNNLDGLINIDFDAKPIMLMQNEDFLSPFIVTQYIMVLKNAVRKGLRKSYYLVTENMHSKIKGKILIGENIRHNLTQGNYVDNICRHQEYGVDNEENRILKKALIMASSILSSYRGSINISSLKQAIARIKPFFREVGDDYDITKAITYNANPIFKDYYQALKYAILILKKSSYGIGKNANNLETTPPYWIDMSKLFELYVLKRLREHYSPCEIMYQKYVSGRYLDYLLKPKDGTEPFVIDAKYKTAYKDGYKIEDIRQVSAYARMKKVYEILNLDDKRKVIKCLIIYPDTDADVRFTDRFDEKNISEIEPYTEFYKIGINLPMQH